MRWFTSDLHLGHYNMTAAQDSKNLCDRPWSSLEEMHEGIIQRWNQTVKHTDVVFILGDFLMGDKKETLPLVRELAGVKHLICGNHDPCWGHSSKKRATIDDWVKRYLAAGMSTVINAASLTLTDNDTKVILNHFPYKGTDTTDDRYEEVRPIDKGRWLIHGHVHEKWRQRGRMINVGMDAWNFYPVSEDTILDMIYAGPQDLDRLDPVL